MPQLIFSPFKLKGVALRQGNLGTTIQELLYYLCCCPCFQFANKKCQRYQWKELKCHKRWMRSLRYKLLYLIWRLAYFQIYFFCFIYCTLGVAHCQPHSSSKKVQTLGLYTPAHTPIFNVWQCIISELSLYPSSAQAAEARHKITKIMWWGICHSPEKLGLEFFTGICLEYLPDICVVSFLSQRCRP